MRLFFWQKREFFGPLEAPEIPFFGHYLIGIVSFRTSHKKLYFFVPILVKEEKVF